MNIALESKLNRHKINYAQEGNRLILGASKVNFLRVFWFIILPFLGGLFILGYNIYALVTGERRSRSWLIMIGVFATAVYNYKKHRMTQAANKDTVILENNLIKIKNDDGVKTFDSRNTRGFEMKIQSLDDGISLGELQLIDNQGKCYPILGFQERGENYVRNDLDWYSDHLLTFIGLQESADE